MVCLSCFHWEAYLCLLFINRAAAMAAEFGKTTSAIDVGIKWRPTPSEVKELGPKFQEYWSLTLPML